MVNLLEADIIPLIRLYEVFKLKSKYDKVTDGIMIVVKSDAKKACIFIDEIIGNQQLVIKSISDYLGTVEGILGMLDTWRRQRKLYYRYIVIYQPVGGLGKRKAGNLRRNLC